MVSIREKEDRFWPSRLFSPSCQLLNLAAIRRNGWLRKDFGQDKKEQANGSQKEGLTNTRTNRARAQKKSGSGGHDNEEAHLFEAIPRKQTGVKGIDPQETK